MIGQHLMVDGVFESPLGEETVWAILSELPGIIGMHIPFDVEEAIRFIGGKIAFKKVKTRTLTRSEE